MAGNEANFRAQLTSDIKRILKKGLSEESIEQVVNAVMEEGPAELADLVFITEAALRSINLLKNVQISKLLKEWKTYATLPAEPQQEPESAALPAPAEPQQEPEQQMPGPHVQQPQLLQQDDEWDFRIDWRDIHSISKTLKDRLDKGKALKSNDRRKLVRRIVDQVRDKVPHANRKIFLQIGMDLKRKYPRTFQTALAKCKIGKKNIVKQMQDTFDNSKRAPRRTVTECEAPNIKTAYGCKKWRCKSLPDNEDVESQEQKRQNLKTYFEQTRPQAWDWAYIGEGMEQTYATQRKEINKQAEEIAKRAKTQRTGRESHEEDENAVDEPETATSELRERWPFLFQAQGMLKHFQVLLGVDVSFMEQLIAYLPAEGKKMIKFLAKSNKGKKIRKEMKRAQRENRESGQNPEMAALIILLTKYFNEDLNYLWRIVDASANEDDISRQTCLPLSPCLVIAGTGAFQHSKIFFTMDKTIVGTAETLIEGVSLLFSSYYVFNIEYAPPVQITLEYIQRCIADINPERGNKRPSKARSAAEGGRFCSSAVHRALPALDRKFNEFFANESDS